MESDYKEYYAQCGELYVTVKKNIAFHCILCENIYKCFKDYADHTKIHYQEYADEELLTDSEQEKETENYKIRKLRSMQPTKVGTPTIKKEIWPVKDSLNIPIFRNEKINKILRPKAIKICERERKFKCQFCAYACPDKSNIQSHVKRHSNDKQRKCTECSKTFHTRTELDTHLRSHTGEKPYLCTVFGCCFMTSSKLSLHRKRRNNIRNKKCTICNYACYDKSTLRKHLAVHSNDRNYKCSQCNASFKAPVALWNHIKIHENKRKYAYKLCESKFNQFAGLYSHLKSSHTKSISVIKP